MFIPDDVDMVLGFMYAGGGSGLSRIAPERHTVTFQPQLYMQ